MSPRSYWRRPLSTSFSTCLPNCVMKGSPFCWSTRWRRSPLRSQIAVMCWNAAASFARTVPRRLPGIPKWKLPISAAPKPHNRASAMSLDLVLRQARIPGGGDQRLDIGVAAGRIVAIDPCVASERLVILLDGRLAIAGFIDTHVHHDKSCISDRCQCASGTLEEAIRAVAAAKRHFTEEDIYARGRRTLEKAIVKGTTRMRTHVEIDPRIGLRSFIAIQRLKRDYAWAIDLDICVFPQEGLLNDPGTDDLLITACNA